LRAIKWNVPTLSSTLADCQRNWKPEDFEFLTDQMKVTMIYGTRDEYLNEDRLKNEQARAKELFGDQPGNTFL
jgi:hypothetical protein